MTASRDAILAELVESDALRPVIDVLACPVCATPRRRTSGLCSNCRTLRETHGRALNQLEVIAFSTPRELYQGYVREWKDGWRCRSDSLVPERLADRVAAPLSAYLEAHADELGIGAPDTAVTWIPSSAELIPRALAHASARGWYAPELERLGEKADEQMRQRHRWSEVRLAATADDWIVGPRASGKRVVLLDDVYTTGGSFHSFAAALKGTDARAVCGVVLVRDIGGSVYQEALRAMREEQPEFQWRPEQRRVGGW